MDGRLVGIVIGSSATVAAGPVFRWIRGAWAGRRVDGASASAGKGGATLKGKLGEILSADERCALTRCECAEAPGPVVPLASAGAAAGSKVSSAPPNEGTAGSAGVAALREELPVRTEIGELSQRVQRALEPIAGLYYFAGAMAASADAYSPRSNPSGSINVSIAENLLMFEEIQAKLSSCRDIESQVARYNGVTGIQRFRNAAASTIQRLLLPRCPGIVSPSSLCVASGVSAILEHLGFCLCEPGDGVLVPAPFYPGFFADFQIRNRVVILPVPTSDQVSFLPTPDDCQAALLAAQQRGVRVRAIILTNPTNPTGTVWPGRTTEALLRWALAEPAGPGTGPLHVIADEVYAASVFGSGMEGFVSAVELAEGMVERGELDRSVVLDRVHLTYGMSKDFTLNGFRVGMLFSRNDKLMQALGLVNMFSWVSQDTQWALAALLEDNEWVDAFLEESRGRLRRSHALVCKTMEDLGIPFVPSGASMFVFVDLRRFLRATSFQAERELWEEMRDGPKLVMVPGEACRAPHPGFFRLCFSSVPFDHLEVACARLSKFLTTRALTIIANAE